MFDVVEHLYPWELHEAFVEIRRILKPDGRLVVAEVGLRRVGAIDPKDGKVTPLAGNLAIGIASFQGGPPAYVPTGVAVGKTGAIYVTSDVRNAIYKLTPQF